MNKASAKKKEPVTIREAEEADALEIKSVVNSVAAEKYYIIPEDSREDWRETIKEIKKRKGLIIIAQVKDKIVGMAYLVRGKFEKNKHVTSLGITILKNYRRMGIGTAMMNHLLEWSQKQEGLEKITLEVFSTNKPAINLYHKLGFKIEGVKKTVQDWRQTR
ncbi:MAG: GNAT family N-acetyltransferase [Candidatus Bathyarchaeota archaeon]|jgi:RimJ/RimL family protein N-acetyltransferase|nr:GNAT family N-acetyltransferase [Candidatus Bathyarchaeota archaeon A05DMB-5]MDH7557501.1 GNAT family N-acetyltransferase [Candidatus Bathyarchaeota archaeon]